jgi:hypothetical protein
MKFNNTKSETASINPVYKEKWNQGEPGTYTGVSLFLVLRDIYIYIYIQRDIYIYIYIQVKKLVIVSQDINYFWSGICSRHKHSG